MKIENLLIKSALTLSVISVLPVDSFAQAGLLDTSFDTDGIVTTAFGTVDDYSNSIAIQSDGKIVVAGYSDLGSQDHFAIARYNTNGSLDNSFDTDGKVTTAIGGSSSNRAHALAIQSDGKIVAVGYYYSNSTTGNDFAVVRYNTNGSLDLSFDSDGIATTGFGSFSNDRAFSVAIQTDGKIVVSGYNTPSGSNRAFAVVRYNSNGSLDTTFNGSGTVSTQIEIGVDEGRSVAIQNDGKIVVAGFCFDNIKRKFTLVRYNSNGSLDSTFNLTGIVKTSIDTIDDAAYAMAIQSDGKIVATGYSRSSSNYEFATVRYNTNGSLDSTFNFDGIVTTNIGTTTTSADVPYAITIQSDGKILVAGVSGYDFGIARYLSDGSMDNTFDIDGIVKTDIDTLFNDELITSMGLQSDGKILVAGHSKSNSKYEFTLARYYNNLVSGIISTTLPTKILTASPNPFSLFTILDFNEPLQDATLELYNSSGQKIRQLIGISGQTISIHRDNLSSGYYFIQLIEKNSIISSVKLIIID